MKFPGTTCEVETVAALREAGVEARVVDHLEFDPSVVSGVVIPGGFSFGDYLRAGAIAARTEAIKGIREVAKSGRPVVGICNGFQVLTEAGLLNGALLPNLSGRFVSKWVSLKVVRGDTVVTEGLEGKLLRMPIAHAEGRYYDEETRASEAAVLKYTSPSGEVEERWNPNGSVLNVAAVANEEGNVVGMMPHPERASFNFSSPDGSTDGLLVLRGLKRWTR